MKVSIGLSFRLGNCKGGVIQTFKNKCIKRGLSQYDTREVTKNTVMLHEAKTKNLDASGERNLEMGEKI